jgi:hypothetical protein
MLSERHLELLTAFVDGELTRRQRKAVLRLLHGSSEARAVLRDLQESAHRLRALPRRSLGGGFAGQIVQVIDEQHMRPTEHAPVRRRRPRWIALAAAAACVLFAVGLGLYVANDGWRRADDGVAARVQPEERARPQEALRLTFKELAQEPKRKLLAAKLDKETAVHMDMTVGNNAVAVAQLRDLFQGQGIKLLVDTRVLANLQHAGRVKMDYLVYAENVQAEELEKILRQLADVPKNQFTLKTTFESMVVTTISSDDRKNLSAALGVDAATLAAPAPPDESKLFDVDVIAAPVGKDKQAAPAPRLERYAMVLASEAGNGPVSAEVRTFLAGRRPQRPGTMQVLLVIRQA